MAGEWIKFEINTLEKPEVMRIARTLTIDSSSVIGLLVRFWIWANRNSVDGVVDGVVAADVDAMLSRPGFADAMSAVGWLKCDDAKQRISIPKFDRHNGESAKKRALKNERQTRWRSRKGVSAVDTKASTPASTREEKRRKETTNGGFARFWTAWPKHFRKDARGKCEEVWRAKNFDPTAEVIVAHVESLKASEQWRDEQYIPAPLVYLNKRRWEGAEAEEAKPLRVALG